MSSRRKYHATIETSDVWQAMRQLGAEAHATLELVIRPSVVTPGLMVCKVNFHDPITVADLGPVYVFQETLAVPRKVDLAPYLHRLIWDAWGGYHTSPWQWTRGMRDAYTRE